MNKIHRYISIFLCLALIIFCFSPIHAAAYYVDPFASTGYAVVGGLAADAISDFSKFVATILASVSDYVGDAISADSLHKFTQWGAFIASKGMYKSYVSSVTEEFSEKSQTNGNKMVLTPELFSILSASYYELYGENLVLPESGLEIYVPPDTLWTSGELITYNRLTTEGFHDLSELNDNVLAGNKITWQVHKDLDSIELFLRTTFVEILESEFSDLSSSLVSKTNAINNNVVTIIRNLGTLFGSLENSIDLLDVSLSGGLTDLKTVTSTFGNSILNKFDTLNTTIKGLAPSITSSDFVNLYDMIAQYNSEFITSIEEIPYQISDSISGFFETQTDVLISIDSQLSSVDSSFSSFVSTSELLSDRIDNLAASLDSFSFDTQSIVDQIFNSEVTIFEMLDSTYNLQYLNFESLINSLSDHFSYISELYLDEYLTGISSMVDSLTYSFEDLLADTSSLVEVTVSLEELAGTDLFDYASLQELLSLNTTDIIDALSFESSWLYDQLSNSFDFSISNLKTDLIEVLDEIKTSVKTIAGTTTADPGSGDDSQDDYEKEKAPLIPWIGSGFSVGGSYFNSIQGFLGDDMDAFLVAGMIFEEFAGMSFFYKLIIISSSVGLIGTLLGMALNVASYSVSQRRREEAAQSRSHSRMERSVAA